VCTISGATKMSDIYDAVDVTIRKCRICGHKEKGRIDMTKHIQSEHTLRERIDALTENVTPEDTHNR